MTVERDWFWFWFYYALWLASVFTLVLVLRQSSENRSITGISSKYIHFQKLPGYTGRMGATHDTIPSPLSEVVRRELFFTFQDGGFTIAFIETLTLNTDIIVKTKFQV